jgi:hypothetical protein
MPSIKRWRKIFEDDGDNDDDEGEQNNTTAQSKKAKRIEKDSRGKDKIIY